MQRIKWLIFSFLVLLTSCYNQGQRTPDAWNLTDKQLDSISFSTTHHYSQNYNFIVKADSIAVFEQKPDEMIAEIDTDSVILYRDDHIVVADIATISTDTIDSVWVKVARDQMSQGWVHESQLLKHVEPDDPISQFIDFFSDSHLLIFLSLFVIISVAYMLYYFFKRNAKIVHFNDISSFYPVLLALLVASSATLYATIQMVAPESWRHFYYHPTLNPFAVPAHLSLFLISIWAMVIVTLAALDDVYHLLSFGEATLYMLGLTGICAVNYIVFSITTLYYVGYVLLIIYIFLAIRHYFIHSHLNYICGNCGAKMHGKGKCPHCGVLNK